MHERHARLNGQNTCHECVCSLYMFLTENTETHSFPSPGKKVLPKNFCVIDDMELLNNL